MKKKFIFSISVMFLAVLLAGLVLTGCSQTPGTGDEGTTPPAEEPGGTDNENPSEPGDEPDPQKLDLVLFIGQSNMAGRGDSAQAVQVGEGHAFEFRAISDPTRLYPLEEPFGAAENNSESGVSENSKTGSLVSAFCESYYSATGTPIVAISCSKGGETIDFFDVDGAPYRDACDRVRAAQEFLKDGYTDGDTEYEAGNTYVVWLQGESDGDAGTSAAAYTETLDRIVSGFKNDIGAEQFFVIPIGGYNDSDGTVRAQYQAIRDAQILYCEDSDDATVISRQLFDLYTYGYMKDSFHYTQEGYNIVGEDAGANMAYFVKNHEKPACRAFFDQSDEEVVKDNGAWQEENGKVVIPAAAAMEESRYANYTTNKKNYSWAAYSDGNLTGVIQTPSDGAQWTNLAYAFSDNPQIHYTFQIRTPGRYYLYMLTSYPDTGSNSVYAGVDGDNLIDCSTQSYEKGLWLGNAQWYFDLEAGEHTLTIYAREDGVILNQFVLSANANERFTDGVPEQESARNQYRQQGMFVEIDGTVNIDLASALEDSSYAYRTAGSANGYTEEFRWERSAAYEGMQVFPDMGVQWSTNNISPKLSYRVDFSTPGDYYVMLYSSFADGNSDSVFVSVDDGKPVTCLSYLATGVGKWMADSAWKINIPYAGVHTINIFAREDGARLHKMYLTKDPVVSNPPDGARVSLQDGTYSADGSGALIRGGSAAETVTVNFTQPGTYYAYLAGSANNAATATLRLGDAPALSCTFAAGFSGWQKAFTFDVEQAGEYAVTLESDGLSVRYFNIVKADIKDKTGVETLVIGDSYTSKTAWKNFDEQTASIGGLTIGIGGTKVSTWMNHADALAIYQPKNIVIHIGVNDIDGGTSGTNCGNSIVELIKKLQSMFPSANIFYVSICNNESYRNKWGEYAVSNNIVKEYMDGSDLLHYIDFASVLQEALDQGTEGIGFRDGLHLNNAAYVLFSETICKAVLAVNA